MLNETICPVVKWSLTECDPSVNNESVTSAHNEQCLNISQKLHLKETLAYETKNRSFTM